MELDATGRYAFADVALARRLERAEGRGGVDFVEARARVFPESRAAWIDVAGTCATFDGTNRRSRKPSDWACSSP